MLLHLFPSCLVIMCSDVCIQDVNCEGGSSAIKEKEPVIDVDNLSSRPKRTRSLIGVLDPNYFRSYAAF